MAVVANTSPVKSQAEVRTVRIFTDEHGRQWRAAVNNLGVHAGYPVSPLTPLFKAPIYPPPKYLKITDIAAGTLKTNTNAWLAELEMRHGEYETLKQQQASAMYGDGAPDAIARGDKALYFRIGPPPQPIEQVLAYRQGHPWVLGKDPEKPKSLEPYFPERAAASRRTFLTAAEERLLAAQTAAESDGESDAPVCPPESLNGAQEPTDAELLARYEEGELQKDIAADVGLTPPEISRRIARARKAKRTAA